MAVLDILMRKFSIVYLKLSSLCNLLIGFVERKTIPLTEHTQLQNLPKISREIMLIPNDED